MSKLWAIKSPRKHICVMTVRSSRKRVWEDFQFRHGYNNYFQPHQWLDVTLNEFISTAEDLGFRCVEVTVKESETNG